MKLSVFAFSRQGCRTAGRVRAFFSGDSVQAYAPERLSGADFAPIEKPSRMFYGARFQQSDALIFVGSCGIAVREIAPHIHDKRTDPAVLVIDELGHYVIPLLSGHIGGANALALRLAKALDAQSVVTTATDINRRFSVDAWAAENGFLLSNMAAAKAVSAAILERDVPLMSQLPVVSALPEGVISGDSGDVGIWIGWKIRAPFAETLRLIPRVLHLGLGCRKGTSAAAIARAVDQVLQEQQIDPRAICCAASIDLKAAEEGLLQFCRERELPVTFYSAEELNALPGDFTPSAFVSKITGVDNVCERAASMGAQELIVRKTACGGVTVALAAEKLEVHFG